MKNYPIHMQNKIHLLDQTDDYYTHQLQRQVINYWLIYITRQKTAELL